MTMTWRKIDESTPKYVPHVRGFWFLGSSKPVFEAVCGIVDDKGEFIDLTGGYGGYRLDEYTHWAPLPEELPPYKPYKLNVQLGSKLLHFKKGSKYTVIGFAEYVGNQKTSLDNTPASYFETKQIIVPGFATFRTAELLIQVSGTKVIPYGYYSGATKFVIYREFSHNNPNPMSFARPLEEFTSDRFELI
jgi:hypothetical protein